MYRWIVKLVSILLLLNTPTLLASFCQSYLLVQIDKETAIPTEWLDEALPAIRPKNTEAEAATAKQVMMTVEEQTDTHLLGEKITFSPDKADFPFLEADKPNWGSIKFNSDEE